MKFGQLLEHLKNTFYLQNNGKNEAERLVPDLFFFFKKKRSFTRGESKWLAASFQYISIAFNLAYRINKLYKTLRLLIQRYAQFWFFRKGPGTIFSTYFFFEIFQEKYFSGYILLTDHISLPDYLYFLRYWIICVLQLFASRVVTFVSLVITLKLTLSF